LFTSPPQHLHMKLTVHTWLPWDCHTDPPSYFSSLDW